MCRPRGNCQPAPPPPLKRPYLWHNNACHRVRTTVRSLQLAVLTKNLQNTNNNNNNNNHDTVNFEVDTTKVVVTAEWQTTGRNGLYIYNSTITHVYIYINLRVYEIVNKLRSRLSNGCARENREGVRAYLYSYI